MSKKAGKSSKKPTPTNSPKPDSERRSANKTAPPTQLEHETGPMIEETAQPSNDETRHPTNSERSASVQAGPEAGPGGKQNAEFVRNSVPFVRTRSEVPPEFDDGKPEGRSAFEAKSQELMEKLYSQGMSIGEVAKLWRMSKSGVWSRVQHVTPKLATPSVQETPPPSSLSQPTNNDSHDSSYPSQVPRISSEIIGDRPRVIEDINGHYPEQTLPGVIAQNNGGSSPVRVVVDANSPYLQELLVQLLHLSTTRNVPFTKYLESGMAVEDLRNASFAATLVPGETSEEFRRNLLSIAKKANLHDRYRTDAGLDDTEVEPR